MIKSVLYEALSLIDVPSVIARQIISSSVWEADWIFPASAEAFAGRYARLAHANTPCAAKKFDPPASRCN